jgi:hypothetical protein
MSEYRFDRYRNGCRMAEGLVLTKPTSVDEAVAIAARLAQAGDIFVLRQDSRIAELEAERDAAKAGEAREVEGLRKIWGEDIHPDADGLIEDLACCYCDGNSAEGCDEDCPRFIAYEALDGSQPALDWLAQREREAAARELNQLGPLGSSNQELFMVPWGEIKQRIAALTNQQPTACPRSEVRGSGEK